MTENEGQYRSNGQHPAHKNKITRFPPNWESLIPKDQTFPNQNLTNPKFTNILM